MQNQQDSRRNRAWRIWISVSMRRLSCCRRKISSWKTTPCPGSSASSSSLIRAYTAARSRRRCSICVVRSSMSCDLDASALWRVIKISITVRVIAVAYRADKVLGLGQIHENLPEPGPRGGNVVHIRRYCRAKKGYFIFSRWQIIGLIKWKM